MSDHDTLLSEFVNITAIDEERAKFYLESSAWKLEVNRTKIISYLILSI